jgi:hypothetical protein
MFLQVLTEIPRCLCYCSAISCLLVPSAAQNSEFPAPGKTFITTIPTYVRRYLADTNEKHKLQVIEHKKIRQSYGLKKFDISDQFRILHLEEDDELHKSFVYTRRTKSETRVSDVDRRARNS